MNVLSISYGRQLFAAENAERKRLRACAREVDSLHMVVFSKKSHCLSDISDGSLHLHPTSAHTRFGMLLAAYRIGSRVLATASGSQRKGDAWIISAQDPFETGLVGYLLSLRYGVPLRIEEHADFFGTPHWRTERILNRIRYAFGVWLLRRASCVRTVSRRAREHLIALGVAPERIALAPVAVELSPFLRVGGERDGEDSASAPREVPVILSIGRLVKQKNLDLLLASFAQVIERGELARLLLVGSGPEEKHLKQRARALGLDAHVDFLPWTDDVPELMAKADILALSSNYEGWGRVILEAMAAGLPGVVTEVGCAGEVFRDGEHGFVVPVGDQEAFASALVRLAGDAELRVRLSSRARRDVAAYTNEQSPYSEAWREAFVPCLRMSEKTG